MSCADTTEYLRLDILYKEQIFIGSQFWKLGSPILRCQHLARAFLLHHHMTEGQRDRGHEWAEFTFL